MEGVQKFFVLFLQTVCKSEIMEKLKMYECNHVKNVKEWTTMRGH